MKNNINDIKKFLFEKKIHIFIITFIFAIIGLIINLNNASYVASQKILLDSYITENNLTDTYINLISSSSVLDEVIDNMGLSETSTNIAGSIKIKEIENTKILEIKYFGKDFEKTEMIANEISNVSIKNITKIYPENKSCVVDRKCTSYKKINSVIFEILFIILGFILSILVFSIYCIFDKKLKNTKQIEEITGLRPIISVPNLKFMTKLDFTIKDILEHKNDVFKILMTNIQFLSVNNTNSKSIVITSPNQKEGKSYIANGLAVEFAKVGKKVILIDSDMRNGNLSKIYNLPNDLGFSNYLSNLDSNGNSINERMTRFINDTEIKNLNVITSGNIPPNPIDLLKVDKIKDMIKELKIFYDIIIFDGISVLEAAEIESLVKVCDLTFIMSRYNQTEKIKLLNAYNSVIKNNAKLVGVGFNNVPNRAFKKKIKNLKKFFIKFYSKIIEKLKNFIYKLKNGLKKIIFSIIRVLKKMFYSVSDFFKVIKNGFLNIENKIKENIKKKNEKVYLLDIPESERIQKNNKEVKKEEKNPDLKKQNEIIKNEDNIVIDKNDSQNNLIEDNYNVKLNKLKASISEKAEREYNPNVRKARIDRSKLEENKKEEKHELSEREILIEKQRIERQKKEEEKRKNRENLITYDTDSTEISSFDKLLENNISLDSSEMKEELIRRQVEIDEMIQMAEKEEIDNDFENNKEYMKKQRKAERKAQKEAAKLKKEQEREAKRERKLEKRKEVEEKRNMQREKSAILKEERKVYKEQEKRKQLEEDKIREEIEEDNLYPKIKF